MARERSLLLGGAWLLRTAARARQIIAVAVGTLGIVVCLGGSPTFLLGAAALLPAASASAADGECVFEGGPGAPTHAYCEEQDCIGQGGLAQCTEPVVAVRTT